MEYKKASYTDFITDLQNIQSSLIQGDLESLKDVFIIRDRKEHSIFSLNLAITLFKSVDSESDLIREAKVLIALSDSIYDNFLLFDRNSYLSNKEYLRHQILSILHQIEDILCDIDKLSPRIFYGLKMSRFVTSLDKPRIRAELSAISSKLIRVGTSNKLRELIMKTVSGQLKAGKITYGQIDKIRKVLNRIKFMEGFDDTAIEKVLVLSDLDPSAIACYLIDRSRYSLLEKESLYDQASELVKFKEDTDILSILIGKYQTNEFSITAKKLESYYRSQSSNISKKIKLHRKEAIDQQNYQRNRKLQVNLPVSQFGLFIRLAMQVGWLGEREVARTFEFFSKNFSTSRTLIISPESLQKKSLDVEYSTAKKMKAHLIQMVNHLNQHHNTSKP